MTDSPASIATPTPAWRWFVGHGVEPECFSLGGDTREAALETAAGLVDRPGQAVTIVEAHQDWPWHTDIFSAEQVLETLMERNEDAFGEDGPDALPGSTRELEKELGAALAGWLGRNGAKSWTFAATRNETVLVAQETDGSGRLADLQLVEAAAAAS